MTRSIMIVTVLVLAVCRVSAMDESNVHSEEFVETINEVQDWWTAGRNFQPDSYVKNLLSLLPEREERLPQRKVDIKRELPERFDSRLTWRRCRSVRKVYDQGNCASAWALVAAGVFTDRLCVSRVENVEVSAQNLLACCQNCGTNCYGGYISDALAFLVKRGVPSNRCHPYEIFGCPKVSGALDCSAVRTLSPRCRIYCRKSYKKKRPSQDLRQAGHAYSLANSSDVIRSEILVNGPVAALMDVYEDFFLYKRGVYTQTAGRLLAQHPIKVIGWGVEEDKPYWLVLNTWSGTWGDKGVVKVARDSNGCNLENRVFAISSRKGSV